MMHTQDPAESGATATGCENNRNLLRATSDKTAERVVE